MRRLLFLIPLTLSAAAPGPQSERSFFVPSFEGMRIYGPFEVEVVEGPPRVTANGDAASLTRLAARVESGVLTINTGTLGFEQRQRDAPDAVRIRISVPNLRSVIVNGGAVLRIPSLRADRVDLGLNGTGSLEVGGLRAQMLNVTHTGNGTLAMAGNAAALRLRAIGSGSVAADGFVARDASIVWNSRGSLRIGVGYTAQVNANAGSVEILGAPECRVSGTAPVACAGKPKR